MTEDNEEAYPPTFSIDLTDRKEAIMRCVELMERLSDEYGGQGRVRKVSENRISVELEYDIPEKESGDD